MGLTPLGVRRQASQVDLWVLETGLAAWKKAKREEVLVVGSGRLSVSVGLAGFHFPVVRDS